MVPHELYSSDSYIYIYIYIYMYNGGRGAATVRAGRGEAVGLLL